MDDTIERPANQDGAVDMLYLVDRLEELVSLGKRVPFSTRVMVEEDEFLALVDQLRVAVPNEIKQAQRVIKERERIIGDAQDEAADIVGRAHEEADRMVSQSALLAEARQRGEDILRRAEEEQQRTKGELDVYVLEQAQLMEDAIQRAIAIMQDAAEESLDSIIELKAEVSRASDRR
ncbi:MAG TPA: hypothetical protein VGR22_01655 [Thermomicrobiales bacterium]|nr:hypothetical protein [Thermomicrobiales bacterium]